MQFRSVGGSQGTVGRSLHPSGRSAHPPPCRKTVCCRWYQHRKDNGLILPNNEGRPEGHFLDALQKVAYRAGITSGICNSCKTRKGRNCKAFGLHNFRKSFATKLSQAAVPIQDIKKALGHADI